MMHMNKWEWECMRTNIRKDEENQDDFVPRRFSPCRPRNEALPVAPRGAARCNEAQSSEARLLRFARFALFDTTDGFSSMRGEKRRDRSMPWTIFAPFLTRFSVKKILRIVTCNFTVLSMDALEIKYINRSNNNFLKLE